MTFKQITDDISKWKLQGVFKINKIKRQIMSNIKFNLDSPTSPHTHLRRLGNFNFSDYHLAHRVHKYIKQKLIKFDISNNGRFEQNQIRKALMDILGETQQELQYVVNNVFRYDYDSDGAVTYQQFIKFCTQQHFGELAIQRLHRMNCYDHGQQRILSKKQFIFTLQYAFNNIKCQTSQQELQKLFIQVDLDRDGFISYEDYFTFLRQYFSQGQIDPANDDRQPVLDDSSYVKSLIRIAKLVFPQIRTLIIQQDTRRLMKLRDVQIRDFISNNFKFCTHNPSKIFIGDLPSFPAEKKQVSYEQGLHIVIQAVFNPKSNVNHFANTINLINSNNILSNQQFVEKFFQNELSAIKVRPARYMMDEIYQHLSKTNKQYQGLSERDYIRFLKDIAQVYQADFRVLA